MRILHIILALWPCFFYAEAFFYCQLDSIDEDYLESCYEKAQARWILPLEAEQGRAALSDALELIENTEDGFIVGFSSHQFFQRFWYKNIDIATNLQPQFLLIALDHHDFLYQDQEVLDLLNHNIQSKPIKIVTPLWDLQDQAFFNKTELRGILNQHYRDLLKRYDADYLVILRGDLSEDLWDVRIVDLQGQKEITEYNYRLNDVIASLRQMVVSQFSLSRIPVFSIISFDREHNQQLYYLREAPEVIHLQPRLMTEQIMEFRLWSYWTPSHKNLLEQRYGLKVLSDRH